MRQASRWSHGSTATAAPDAYCARIVFGGVCTMGAAGQAGTDPATLTRTEEQRVAKQKDKAKKGAPTIKPGSGTDTRYGAGSN